MGEVTFGRTVYKHIEDEGRKTFVYLLDQNYSPFCYYMKDKDIDFLKV
jgi:hypothetical protein